MPYILPLVKVPHDLSNIVGQKAHSVSQLHDAGLPISPGFVITSEVFRDFFSENRLEDKIEKELELYDLSNPDTVLNASRRIRDIITTSQLPPDFCSELFDSYDDLVKNFSPKTVSVRTSLIDHDLNCPHPLFLEVKGEHTLAEIVKEIYANLYTPNFLLHRGSKHIPLTAIVIQRMFNSICSGVVHTNDPYTADKKVVIVEAVWGLSEILQRQNVSRDKYGIEKSTKTILFRKTYPQEIEMLRKDNKVIEVPIPFSRQVTPKLTDKEIQKLFCLSRKLKKVSVHPQTLEWGYDGHDFCFFQSQDMHSLSALPQNKPPFKLSLPVLMEGYGDNPGVGSGLLSDNLKQYHSFTGDIILIEEYSPDILEQLKSVNGIVNSDSDNKREIKFFCQQEGIPLIHIHPQSVALLKGCKSVTIDGSSGFIYKGDLRSDSSTASYERELYIEPLESTNLVYTQLQDIKTKLDVYVDLGELRDNEIYDADLSDGCAVFNSENFFYKFGIHPYRLMQDSTKREVAGLLSSFIKPYLTAFKKKPFFYKLSDLQSNKLHDLRFSETFEKIESLPMLGLRGSYRLLRSPELIQAQIQAIQQLSGHNDKVSIVLPFARVVDETSRLIEELVSKDRDNTLHVWLSLESPANLINIPQLVSEHVQGVIVDVKKLTTLTLCTDPDNSTVAGMYDEFDPAVLWLLKRLLVYCKSHSLRVILTNFSSVLDHQRLSVLLQLGVDGISVAPKYVLEAKKSISAIERNLTNNTKGQ